MKDRNGLVLIIMPRSSKAWRGAEALWITAAGWAMASKRYFGEAKVLTQDRIAEPEEVLQYPTGDRAKDLQATNSQRARYLPPFIKQFIKDISLYLQSREWSIVKRIHPSLPNVQFIWEQHDLFAGPGEQLSKSLGVPLIKYVHAPVVWETAKWGVRRYWWGRCLEHFVERPQLLRADVVACVSNEVADKVRSLGVDDAKILVSPMAVDDTLFEVDDKIVQDKRRELNLSGKLVIGWIGSFRSFHGLEVLITAVAAVIREAPNVVLLLVGDGKERSDTEQLARELGIYRSVVFAGRQSFTDIPTYVALFDVAIVSAKSREGFHYFPLKLKEYLIAGKPTLAPRAGDIPASFEDRNELLLYEAGNVPDLKDRIKELVTDEPLRQRLSKAGKKRVMANGTWSYELSRLMDMLNKEKAT